MVITIRVGQKDELCTSYFLPLSCSACSSFSFSFFGWKLPRFCCDSAAFSDDAWACAEKSPDSRLDSYTKGFAVLTIVYRSFFNDTSYQSTLYTYVKCKQKQSNVTLFPSRESCSSKIIASNSAEIQLNLS